MAFFGRADIILRTADITRNRQGFERLKEAAFRNEFYARLNDLMRRLEYKVVACAIKKDRHLERYGLEAIDPYMLSLHVLVERFCFELGYMLPAVGLLSRRKEDTRWIENSMWPG